MDSFLGALAKAYSSKYDDLSQMCFVFPNKRAGTFFLKRLSEAVGNKTILAPRVMSVLEFVMNVGGRIPDSRIDLLFRLYKLYRRRVGSRSNAENDDLVDFDRFAPWGEILIEDFSEVEQYGVDSSQIFQNVRDLNNIASNFLTPEQVKVIERYFGYSPAVSDVERFWRSVYDDDAETKGKLSRRFVQLWALMPELFEDLKADLEASGLCLPGSGFRLALEEICGRGRDAIPFSKVVMAGFNSLSTTESRIFEELQKMKGNDGLPFCDFHWDLPGPVLGDTSDVVAAAVKTMRRLRKNFPEPVWSAPYMEKAKVDTMPEKIEIVASPSNSAQTKIAAGVAGKWLEKFGEKKIDDARMAIVVPDESLLLPLVHSLPENMKSVNLTMGYSMRYTAMSSLIYHLRRLFARKSGSGLSSTFHHADLDLFLSHPLVHFIAGSGNINRLKGEIRDSHRIRVPLQAIAKASQPLANMLGFVPANAGASEAADYLAEVLDMIDAALAAGGSGVAQNGMNTNLERSHVQTYRIALNRLRDAMEEHDVNMRPSSVFYLTDRLLSGESVTFKGEPLAGLQVMGLLETRGLDFDHLVIMSMNDKIMPSKTRKRTYIPDSLRRGYGLPLAVQGEELFTYYFYHLLARAKDVTLIYDSRAGEGMRSGGKSRFIYQLEYLHPSAGIRHADYQFKLTSGSTEGERVVKDEQVMRELGNFKKIENGWNLSSSALMKYTSCKLKFYLEVVKGIKDSESDKDYIDAIAQGNIVHRTMQNLYVEKSKQKKFLNPAIRIDRKFLEGILNDPQKIRREVRRAVNSEHYKLKGDDIDRPLPVSSELIAARLARQVEDVVRHDIELAPFELLGVEFGRATRLKVSNTLEVNFKYTFDRVDRVNGKIRIVDYKTGSSHVSALDVEDFFNGWYDAKYGMQLMIYALLLERQIFDETGEDVGDVEMVIYDVNTIAQAGPVKPSYIPGYSRESEEKPDTKQKHVIEGLRECEAMFMPRVNAIIEEIFDADIDFTPTEDKSNCRYCYLKGLCNNDSDD
ncbi:MAG: PD-(D/E)XK nuclease family protein [Candidatus Amulumruptor caecigallinarius]|nr:PD-(D/E)XK nuclease family protein [Candidatus Amulumruptor caecigallinarius]